MKSAYELAMERLGGKLREYTDEQKEQLAEVDRLYDSKAAKAKLDADARLTRAPGDAEKATQIQDDMTVELASVEQRRARDKGKLREQFDQDG